MLKNKNFKELAKEYIDRYELKLDGLNVMVPAIEQETFLAAAIAEMTGAANIYMYDPKININQNTTTDEFNIKFVGSISADLLSSLSIILKDSALPLKGDKIGCLAKKSSVISLFPDNLDFIRPQTSAPELFNQKDLSIIGPDPEDTKLGLYQRFSHIIVKRCHKLGIDIFKSRILLIGNGAFLNCTLSLLKSAGAIVYTYNTTSASDQSYVLKHLKELDAIITMDYPQTGKQLIGSKGIISISDIVDLCPQVKLLHICGKNEENSLKLGNINCFPKDIEQEELTLHRKELGERGITELTTISLKIAENFLKSGKNTLHLDDSVVTYKLLNKTSSLLLGGKLG